MPDADDAVDAGPQNDAGQASSTLLDAPNRAIIEALQRDGRQPYGAIAEAVGLSEAAVRRRVSVEGDVRHVAEKLSAMHEADYVVMCAGRFDILAEIVCEDDERLLHVLNDSVRSIPGVRATETFLYLKLAKQTYTWGTR